MNYEYNNERGQIAAALLVVVGIFVAIILVGVLGTAFKLFTLPWVKFDAKVQTNQDIIKKTYNADNALYNYHWFQEHYEAIGAADKKVVIAKVALEDFEASAGPRDKWTFEDKTEDARLRAVLQGNRSHYEELVAEYNARAKEVDRNIFKDGLPLFVDLK